MRNKSVSTFFIWSFLSSVFLLSIDVIAQLENGQTKANICRHVAILPRNDKNEPYTARCFIPSKTIFGDRFSLATLVSKEWQWIYKHNGTASGQMIFRSNDSITIISEKSCVDRGRTIASPYREYYSTIGNKSEPDYPVGDFSTRSFAPGDAYANCVNNPTQWYDFKNLSETEEPLEPGTIQYIRCNLDGHFSSRTKMIPYNFSYTQETLDAAFRRPIEDLLNNVLTKPTNFSSLSSGTPIVIAEYPFEIGLSVLGSPEYAGAVVTDVHHDLSALGWERALQAREALSGRINSAEEFPETISRAELIQFTVLTLLSIALYWQELRSCAKERAEDISAWNESTGVWVCVTEENSDQYLDITRTGTARVVVALITSIISIIATIFIFLDSSLRYQKILRVTQGGVITYGKQIPAFSVDELNLFAGTGFAVAHWMEVHVITSGIYGLFTAVCVVSCILLILLLRMTFLFTLLREHHLDHREVRQILFPLKWTTLFLRTLFARLLPARWNKINSYEVSFKNLCQELTEYHGHPPILEIPNRGLWNVMERYRLDKFTGNNENDNNEAAPIDRTVNMHMNTVMGTPVRRITLNEIEKAAEVLSANAFGMLSSIQALTLMYGHNLSAAADRYARKGQLPSVADVRGLARIWYVQEMVLLSRQGIHPDNPQRIDMEAHSRGNPPPYADELKPFCPAIGVRPNVLIPQSQLNDGVAYVTYRTHE